MATINFLYRSKKEKSNLTLRLLFRSFGKDNQISADSKISISKDFFFKTLNQKKIKDVKLINEQTRVKNDMDKLKIFILEKFEKANISDVDKYWLNHCIESFYRPQKEVNKVPYELTKYFDFYIELLITNKNTKKKLTTTKNKIEKYEKIIKRKLYLEELNNVEINQFKKYLNQNKYSHNTILGDLTNIKTICRHAKTSLKINDEILNLSLKKERTEVVYLSFDEIEKIIELNNLPEHLDNARDWLVISCYTGQRVSDFMKFNKNMIRTETEDNIETMYVEFVQKKTGQSISVPLSKKIKHILNKRNGEFPRPISDVKYNLYIKKVVEEAKINNIIQGSKINSKLNRKVKGNYPKFELITSHIGRRSFATNLYGKIATPIIMAATGHQSEKMFLNYIGKSQSDRAKSLSKYFEHEI
jgi:integrase